MTRSILTQQLQKLLKKAHSRRNFLKSVAIATGTAITTTIASRQKPVIAIARAVRTDEKGEPFGLCAAARSRREHRAVLYLASFSRRGNFLGTSLCQDEFHCASERIKLRYLFTNSTLKP